MDNICTHGINMKSFFPTTAQCLLITLYNPVLCHFVFLARCNFRKLTAGSKFHIIFPNIISLHPFVPSHSNMCHSYVSFLHIEHLGCEHSVYKYDVSASHFQRKTCPNQQSHSSFVHQADTENKYKNNQYS
jgi:hypothetical protein